MGLDLVRSIGVSVMLGVWVAVSVMVGVLVGGVLVLVAVFVLEGVRDGVYEAVNEAVAVRGVPVLVKVLEGVNVLLGVRVRVGLGPGVLVNVCVLNAGCRITSIQAFLGHKKLNTTMIYARAYDQTVAEDYFTAMRRVEQRLDISPAPQPEPETEENYEVVKVPEHMQILTWVEQLAHPDLNQQERLEIAQNLKRTLSLGWVRNLAPPLTVAAVV